jgi:hypothetical protein
MQGPCTIDTIGATPLAYDAGAHSWDVPTTVELLLAAAGRVDQVERSGPCNISSLRDTAVEETAGTNPERAWALPHGLSPQAAVSDEIGFTVTQSDQLLPDLGGANGYPELLPLLPDLGHGLGDMNGDPELLSFFTGMNNDVF